MSDGIKAALTPEQWAAKDMAAPHSSGLDWHITSRGELESATDCGGYNGTCYIDEVARHGVAALCLHGQPFGFTHADIALLKGAQADDFEPWFAVARIQNLIDRIAALLPPGKVSDA